MVLILTVRTIFSSAVGLRGLQLIVSRLEFELYGAQDGVDATLLDVHCVDARLDAVKAFDVRAASVRWAWRLRGRRPRRARKVLILMESGLRSELTIRRAMQIVVSNVRKVVGTRTGIEMTHLMC